VFAPPLPGSLFLQLLDAVDPQQPGAAARADARADAPAAPAMALAQYAAERRATAA
jgi:hypothetical protein